MDKLPRIENETDLDTLTVDQLYIFLYLMGIKDQDLHCKFLEMKVPRATELGAIICAHESTSQQAKDMCSSPAIAPVSSIKKRKGAPTHKHTMSHKGLRGCFHCGSANQTTKDCLCENLTCHASGKSGHIAPVCISQDQNK